MSISSFIMLISTIKNKTIESNIVKIEALLRI